MSRPKFLSLMIGITLATLLVSCGGQQTVPAQATPVPPTATLTGRLSVGATFVLGPATVEVIKLDESTTSPVFKKSPQSGMKFVLVELKINQIQSGGELASDRIFLENASGKQYGPPKVYGKQEPFGDFEAESQKVSGGGKLNLFFEVAKNENLDTLKLSYR